MLLGCERGWVVGAAETTEEVGVAEYEDEDEEDDGNKRDYEDVAACHAEGIGAREEVGDMMALIWEIEIEAAGSRRWESSLEGIPGCRSLQAWAQAEREASRKGDRRKPADRC